MECVVFMGEEDTIRQALNVYRMRLLGAEVLWTDSVADGDVIFGDFKKYVANLASPQQVVSQFDINTNSYKYLGAAEFDGKVALAEAFVTIQAV